MKAIIEKSMRCAAVAIFAVAATIVFGDETTVSTTGEEVAESSRKLTLHEKEVQYEQAHEAFRNAQRQWVLAQLDRSGSSVDPSLLRAQFIRDNFEWRVQVEELKFDYQHGLGQAHRKPEGVEIEEPQDAYLATTVATLKTNARAAKDSRQWRAAIAYERAASEIVALEKGVTDEEPEESH